jgi:signal peptidase I
VVILTTPQGAPEVTADALTAGVGSGTADPWAAPATVNYAEGGRRRGAARPRRRSRDRAKSGRAARRSADLASPAPPKAPATASRARRLAARLLLGGPVVSLVALLLAVALPVLFGCRSMVIMSGSMEPAIRTGSVVVVRRIPAAEIAVGDVVSFLNPEAPGRTLTHRVQAVTGEGGRIEVETRGDANTGTESWSIDATGTVGRVAFHLPLLGYLLAPLQGTLPRLVLVVSPALLLGVSLVGEIWRSPAGARRRSMRRTSRPARSGA